MSLKTSAVLGTRFLALLALSVATSVPVYGESSVPVVIFSEPNFPSADTASPSLEQLRSALPSARVASAAELGALLDGPATHLLVLPYGSAFPEASWSHIFAFLQRGGNLLTLGGRPFTRAAYQATDGWHLRDYSVRFSRQLLIDQYQDTPGSNELDGFATNPDLTFEPARFRWTRAFSPVIRLSAVDLYARGGSAGSLDARLDTLAWGVRNSRRLAAPLVQIDHLRNGFEGSRWIFLNADLRADFYSSPEASNLVRTLADRALAGAEEFSVRPTLPLYLPGEPVQLELEWQSATGAGAALTLELTTYPEAYPANRVTTKISLPLTDPLTLPAARTKGLQIIEARLFSTNQNERDPRATYHSAYWIRDEAVLDSGPRLSVNGNFFELDGHPLAVAGTTYMSSDTQRLYFAHPNVYVWNRDLSLIHDAGLNMLRTGWWTGWDKLCDENGQPYERTLRTIEAVLMTARKYNLPVQFNFFAFLPDTLGGANAYLDPQAVRRQQTLVRTIVARFRGVPYLAWDLINEPSFSKHLWTLLPNGDTIELQKWNEWLTKRYPNPDALAAAWNVLPSAPGGTIPVPEEIEFSTRGMYVGHNSLKLYDYSLFAQESFAAWVKSMREKIRSTGSRQLVIVGQDEGGYVNRLSPAFFGPSVDFSTTHSWWQNDHLLWDSLVAKQPGQTMLVQETGLQRELNLDETARRSMASEGALLERKIAAAYIQGSGAIEWQWNTNSYMTEGNETPIGAVRTDGTEKEEATVLRAFAQFAKSASPYLVNPKTPDVAIITSQAAQFSVLQEFQIAAQRRSVRALAYGSRIEPYVIAENQIARLGQPKLAILPSAQLLRESTWQTLLAYVASGGQLLITGPINRNEHFEVVDRTAQLNLDGTVEPLTYHEAMIALPVPANATARPKQNTQPNTANSLTLDFDQNAQNWLESVRFTDNATFKEIPHGQGRIFWAAYPVELSGSPDSATALYNYVLDKISLKPAYELRKPVSSGVLIYRTALEHATMYIAISDSANSSQIDLVDGSTKARLTFTLPGEHAAIAIIDNKTGRVAAQYGF